MARGVRTALLGGCVLLSPGQPEPWTSRFEVDPRTLASTGRSPYLSLEPGHVAMLEAGNERLVITVLGETRRVAGVETRVVEERETHGARLVEVSRNFLAIDRATGNVYYFGEAVDLYRNGRVVGHEGSWLAGERGARFGLLVPGAAKLGDRYYQEYAPGQAMDRARVVSLRAEVSTPAGRYANCLKVEETTPLEPGAKEYKYYAPGVGLVQDGRLKLVTAGPG